MAVCAGIHGCGGKRADYLICWRHVPDSPGMKLCKRCFANTEFAKALQGSDEVIEHWDVFTVVRLWRMAEA